MAEATAQQDKVLRLIVVGTPYPKERPRLGKGKVYTPKKTKAAEAFGAVCVKQAMKQQKVTKFEGAVSLSVQFYRNRKVTAKPDLDNLVKLVKDYLEKGGAFAVGDEQVTTCFAGKFQSTAEETVIILTEDVG